MGESKVHLEKYREAIHFFSVVVGARPKNASGWEALIRCLYKGGFYEEGLQQIDTAISQTNKKPLFPYYKAALFLALGKSKEGILQLEGAMEKKLLNW